MPEYSGNKFDTYNFSSKYSDPSYTDWGYWKDSIISLRTEVDSLRGRVRELEISLSSAHAKANQLEELVVPVFHQENLEYTTVDTDKQVDDEGLSKKEFIDKYLEYVDHIHDNLTSITDLVMGK